MCAATTKQGKDPGRTLLFTIHLVLGNLCYSRKPNEQANWVESVGLDIGADIRIMHSGAGTNLTQGIFLLLATRDPLANRRVITFAAWLNIAHAAVMTIMAIHLSNERQGLLIASAVFGLIGVALIALVPAKQS